MSARRCPTCGGLVGNDAEWCGQCLTRLDEPTEREAPAGQESRGATAPADGPPTPRSNGDAGARAAAVEGPGGRAIRSGEDGVVWDCPTCGQENPIERANCSVCGTPFGRLFESPDPGPRVDPGRAAALSLIFPGVGHAAAGRRAEGLARAVIFIFALTTGLLTLFAGRSGNAIFLAVTVLSLGAAAALYVLSTLDAGRAAQGIGPIVSTRVMLYGAVGLMLLTMLLLTLATFQARG